MVDPRLPACCCGVGAEACQTPAEFRVLYTGPRTIPAFEYCRKHLDGAGPETPFQVVGLSDRAKAAVEKWMAAWRDDWARDHPGQRLTWMGRNSRGEMEARWV